MIPNELIAHDLTMIYMRNRYGNDIYGTIDLTNGFGSGEVKTSRFPLPSEPIYRNVITDEKGFLGTPKFKKVQDGYAADPVFEEMTTVYLEVYTKFYELLSSKK